MNDIPSLLEQWHLDIDHVRRQMYRAPSSRERERWHALWLATRGWSSVRIAEALDRNPHTIRDWLTRFRRHGPANLAFKQTGGSPPVLDTEPQAQLPAAVQSPPEAAGLAMSNWNWKVVREYLRQRFDCWLCRSSCLNYLHRLGFVLKRPKKRLLKANEEKRKAFIALYGDLQAEALSTGAKILFVDEAHFWADADLRGKWVRKGQPALVDSTSPSLSQKAAYYSGVCLESGEVEAMKVVGNCTALSSAAFLRQLRDKYLEPLIVVWDNAPAHHGEAIRDYLRTPELKLRLVPLPGYSPDLNADEAIWDWAREEVTANVCLGTVAKVEQEIGRFFRGLVQRSEEVKSRCWTKLQAEAALLMSEKNDLSDIANAVPIVVSV